MLNYQSNALKFTNTGGKVHISLQYVEGLKENEKRPSGQIRQESKKAIRDHGMEDLSSDEESDGFYEQDWDDKIILTI